MPPSSPRPVYRIADACGTHTEDRLATEEPMEIRINDEPLAITMRTPGHDRELTAGFCFTEGIVKHPDDLESINVCSEATFGNVMLVKLSDEATAQRQTQIDHARRQMYLSSSCGLCGKQSLDRIEQTIAPITARFTITQAILETLPSVMRQAQATFDQTGGLHAAALFTPAGELKVLREDVGRHNAVDKVVGWAVLTNSVPLNQHLLLVSGRASFEIMQKAAMAGLGLVAAVSAPSSLAVDFAVRMNITLIGFLRPGRMNVYHDHDRVN